MKSMRTPVRCDPARDHHGSHRDRRHCGRPMVPHASVSSRRGCVAGWTCVAVGLAARPYRSVESRMDPSPSPWASTWLLPDISSCLSTSRAAVAPMPLLERRPVARDGGSGWLWLGIAGHAVITFPDGRVARGPLLAAVVGAYALSLGIAIGAGPARPLLAVLFARGPACCDRSLVAQMLRHGSGRPPRVSFWPRRSCSTPERCMRWRPAL